MITEYTLFLDESYDDDTEVFCIAGCIVKNSDLKKLEDSIRNIKTLIWTEDEIETMCPVLHSTDLNYVYKNRKNDSIRTYKLGAYNVLAQKDHLEIKGIYDKVYDKLSVLMKTQDIVTLCCIIDRKKFKTYYSVPTQPRLLDDWYDIAMQEIIESFTHYLCAVNGIGSVMYEARNNANANQSSSPDNKMFHNFCKIKVNGKGISYITNRTIYDRIRFLDIVTKKEDQVGLQLADFIAFNYIKWFQRQEKDRTDFMKKIHAASYNGNYALEDYDFRACWGTRILPNDVLRVKRLEDEIKTLKKAYDNLKRDRNKKNRQLEKVKMEKKKVQKEYDELVFRNSIIEN